MFDRELKTREMDEYMLCERCHVGSGYVEPFPKEVDSTEK